MANSEGIIFHDILVNNQELFIDFFVNYYKENKGKIDEVCFQVEQSLMGIDTNLTANTAQSFKDAWDRFEREVLLNEGDLQLIVGYRDGAGGQVSFSEIVKQSDVEGVGINAAGNKSYGIQSGHQLIQDSIAALKGSRVEEFLREHSAGFINQLDTTLSRSEAEILHDYHTSFLNQIYQNSEVNHLTGKTWIEAFYSTANFWSGHGLGQAYDAFMNHLANYRSSVYDYLTTGGQDGDPESVFNANPNSPTVYVEEGGVEGHFPALLGASKNHTGWYTGGDIVIVNPETMSVVYNIQLKTTGKNVLSVFGERVKAIKNFIINFNQTKDPEEMGKKLFKFFLTSASNNNAFNNMPQETIDKTLKEVFGSILK